MICSCLDSDTQHHGIKQAGPGEGVAEAVLLVLAAPLLDDD